MVGEVEFHTGIAEPIGFACRLLRKAVHAGASLVCTAPAATLDELDRALWTFEEREFIAHLRVPGAPPARARRTQVWLAPAADASAQGRVLVNLGAEVAPDPALFARVIELVASDADAAAQGRERWRAYKALGFEIRHHAARARA